MNNIGPAQTAKKPAASLTATQALPGNHANWKTLSKRISLMRVAAFLLLQIFMVTKLQAHDVIWWQNRGGLFPSTPLQLYFGLDDCGVPDYDWIGVVPSVGEPCTVVVNLNPSTSSAISTSFPFGNVGNAVWIYVGVNPFASMGTVSTTISGEWHATGSPANSGCTATNPNPFSVPVTIKWPTPWKISLGTTPWTVQIDTGGDLLGLRAYSSLKGPHYNIGFGSRFTLTADEGLQFYRGTHRMGSPLGGIITDTFGAPQSGISLGFLYGGLSVTTLTDGSFSLYDLPRGTNVLAVTKPFTFVDSGGSNRTESVGVNIEVPTANPTNVFYQMLQLQVAMALAAATNCNCTPWCAIGYGTLDGAQTPVFYSGGALPPKNGPANCGQVQVTVTPPNGVAYPITPGSSKHQNSGPNPASGTWTVSTTVCGQSKQASITVP
jgi:hypothetical protein